MACDIPALLERSKCFPCNLSGSIFSGAELVLLCAIRDGTAGSCDPQTLVAQATCVAECIPPGMMPFVKLAILCDLAF